MTATTSTRDAVRFASSVGASTVNGPGSIASPNGLVAMAPVAVEPDRDEMVTVAKRRVDPLVAD